MRRHRARSQFMEVMDMSSDILKTRLLLGKSDTREQTHTACIQLLTAHVHWILSVLPSRSPTAKQHNFHDSTSKGEWTESHYSSSVCMTAETISNTASRAKHLLQECRCLNECKAAGRQAHTVLFSSCNMAIRPSQPISQQVQISRVSCEEQPLCFKTCRSGGGEKQAKHLI